MADITAYMIMYGSYPEMMVNGGFETVAAGPDWGTWVETVGDGALADETVIVHSGTHSAKLTAGATANTKLDQTIAVEESLYHLLGIWARGDGTYSGRYLIYDVTNGANIVAATSLAVVAAAWTLVPVSFAVPAHCASIRVDLMCPSTAAGIAYFDDVMLSKSGYASNGDAEMQA